MLVYEPELVPPVWPDDYRGFVWAWLAVLRRRQASLRPNFREWLPDTEDYGESDKRFLQMELTADPDWQISENLWWAILCEAEAISFEHGKEVHRAADALEGR